MKGLTLIFCIVIGLSTYAQKLGVIKNFFALERTTISKLDPYTNQSNEINVIEFIALGVDQTEGDVTIFQLRSIQELDQLIEILKEANALVDQRKSKEWKLNFLYGPPSTVSVDKKTNSIKIQTVHEITLDGEGKLECFFNVDEINKLIQLLEENKSLLS